MLYIACIIYNIKIENIKSLSAFVGLAEKHDDVQIMILDNSTEPEFYTSNREGIYSATVRYVSNEGNIGLSKSYNKVLQLTGPEDWILWSDDDTDFSSDFLENAYQTLKNDKYGIITGIINTTIHTVLSPVSRNDSESVTYKPESVYHDVYCINSGICIKRSLYDKIGRYDEGLFIDMIDYWLFDELHKKKLDQVFIVNGTIIQEFSGTIRTSISSQLRRFKIYSKDFSYYCRIEHKSRYYKLRVLTKRLINILFGSLLKGSK